MKVALEARGQFGHKPLVSACRLAPGELLPTQTYGAGTVFAHHSLYGCFRTPAGGTYSVMMRNMGVLGAAEMTVFSDRNGAGRLDPVEEFFDAFSGWVFYVPIEDGIQMTGLGLPPRRASESFELQVTSTGSRWKEGRLLDLTGRYVSSCALQWLTPLENGAHMQVYQMQRASGTILGEPVEGFYDITPIYSSPGTTYFNTLGGRYQTWTSFGTEYEDGTMEVGQLCASDGDWCFALVADRNGPVVLTTDVSARSSFDDNGYPQRTIYDIAGEQWEWVAMDGGGLYRGPEWKAPIQQAEGYVRRVGETRRIVTALGNNAANIAMPRI